jgi:NADH-quinone oxidoreductase subunit M
MNRSALKRFIPLLAAVFLLIFPGIAAATELGVQGPSLVELRPEASGFGAKVTITNTGADKARVRTLSLRQGGDPEDPRAPQGLSLHFGGGGLSAVIGPNETRDIQIEWTPVKGRPAHEFYGHVLVELDEEGAAPLVIGVHGAPESSWNAFRPLFWLCILPLLGIGLVFGLRARGGDRARQVVGGTAIVQILFLALLVAGFDAGYTRFEGGDGLQFIQRIPLSRSMGWEWFVALDGISYPLVLLVPVLLLLASRATPPNLPKNEAFWSALLLLDAGLVVAFVARDTSFLFLGLSLAVVATVWVVQSTSEDGARAARGVALHLVLGALLVGFALWMTSRGQNPLYLADGTPVARSFSLTELAHGGWVPVHETLLGTHSVKLVFVSLFLGCALLAGAPPFHGWLTGIVTRSPNALGVVVAGAVPALGAYVLLRVGFAVLPDGMAWAAGGIGVFGLLGALYAALAAVGANDLRRLTTRTASVQSGLVFVALSSLTAIGVQGAVLTLVSRGIAVGGLLAIASVIEERLHTSRFDRLGGIASQLPVLGMLAAVVFVAAAAGGGTLPFLGFIGTVFGVAPMARTVGIATPMVGAILAVALARGYEKAFLGKFPERWQKSRFLEAHGGNMPLLEERELGVLLTVTGLSFVLGLWPAPLNRIIDASALDQAEYANKPGALEIVRSDPARDEIFATRD